MWRIWRRGEFLSTDFLIKETCPRGKMKGDKVQGGEERTRIRERREGQRGKIDEIIKCRR
jgi:hypothetical protein